MTTKLDPHKMQVTTFRYDELMLSHLAIAIGYASAGISLNEMERAANAANEGDDRVLLSHIQKMPDITLKEGADKISMSIFKALEYLLDNIEPRMPNPDKLLLARYIADNIHFFAKQAYAAEEGPKKND